MNDLAWAIVLTPFGGVLLSVLAERSRNAARAAMVGTLASFVCASILLIYRLDHLALPNFLSVITFWSLTPYQKGVAGTVISTFAGQVGVMVTAWSAVLMWIVGLTSLLVQAIAVRSLRADDGLRRHLVALQFVTLGGLAIVAAPDLLTFVIGVMVSGAALCFMSVGGRSEASEGHAEFGVGVTWKAIVWTGLFAILAIVFYKYSGNIVSSQPLPPGETTPDPFDFGTLATLWNSGYLIRGVGPKTVEILSITVIGVAALLGSVFPFGRHQTTLEQAPGGLGGLGIAVGLYLPSVLLLVDCYSVLRSTDHALTAVAFLGTLTLLDGAYQGLRASTLSHVAASGGRILLGVCWLALAFGGPAAALLSLDALVVVTPLGFLAVSMVRRLYRTDRLEEVTALAGQIPRSGKAVLLGLLGGTGALLTAGWWSLATALAFVLRDRLTVLKGVALHSPTHGHIDIVVQFLSAAALIVTIASVPVIVVYALGELNKGQGTLRRRGFHIERIREVDVWRLNITLTVVTLGILLPILTFPWGGIFAKAATLSLDTTSRSAFIVAFVLALLGQACVAGALWRGWRLPHVSHSSNRAAQEHQYAHLLLALHETEGAFEWLERGAELVVTGMVDDGAKGWAKTGARVAESRVMREIAPSFVPIGLILLAFLLIIRGVH